MNLFELYATIGIKMDEFERGLESASERFESFSSGIKNVGEKVSNAGGTLTKTITLPVVGLGTAVLKTGMDYEAGMSKVQAISGATGDEMTLLGQKAMEMAAKTKFSTADSAEAYQYMAMAGWKAGDMVDGLAGIMNLAAASGENLGTTSDIVTDALTAFGLKASDSGRFADVLAAASNNANTNVSMLGESFKYVAPVAGAMGYSVEDVSVALGLMANSGIKASQAGTSLRSAMTNMASPTENMAIVMDKYGISLTDADGKMLSFAEVMGLLREKMGGLDEATQASAAAMLFGKEAMSGMLAIINAAPEDFDKLTEAINNSAGTTEEMASIMQDNAAGAFERLKSAVNVLFTQMSEHLIPAFTAIVEKVTEVINWFGSLDEGTQKLILTIAGIAAAVGPVLIVIGKIITAIGTISGAVSGVVGVVTKGITSIIGIGGKLMGGIKSLFALIMAHPVVAVVTAVVGAVVLLYTKCEWFRDAVHAVIEAVVGFFKGAWEAVVSVWNAAGEFFSGIVGGIKGAFDGIGEFIGGLFKSAWEAVRSAWNGAKEFFSGIWEGIKSVFSTVAEVIGGVFGTAWEMVQNAWNGAKEFFSGIWDGIKSVFSVAAEVIGGAFQAAWEAVSGAWDAAAEFFSGIAAGIQSVFETVTTAIGSAFSSAWEMVQSAWSAASDFFSGVWESIKSGVGAAGEKIIGALKGAWDAVKSAWDAAASFFSGIASKIIGAFTGIGGKFLDIGRNIVNGIKNGIAGAWDSFMGWLGGKIGGIASGAKKVLGIKSPSRVFAGIGENMVLGLAEGWDDEYDGIKRKIEKGLNFETATVGVNASYTGAAPYGAHGAAGWTGNGMGSTTVNIYSPEAVDGVQAARVWKKEVQKMALAYI